MFTPSSGPEPSKWKTYIWWESQKLRMLVAPAVIPKALGGSLGDIAAVQCDLGFPQLTQSGLRNTD